MSRLDGKHLNEDVPELRRPDAADLRGRRAGRLSSRRAPVFPRACPWSGCTSWRTPRCMPTAPDSAEPVRPRQARGPDVGAGVGRGDRRLAGGERPSAGHLDVHTGAAGGAGGRVAAWRGVHRPCRRGPSCGPVPPISGSGPAVAEERVAAVQAEGRRPVLASGCGAVSTFLAEPSTVEGRPLRGIPPGPERLRRLFKALFARGERYKDTGGIHAAALVEVGRLDRRTPTAPGRPRRGHRPPQRGGQVHRRRPARRAKVAGLGLLVTGRISAELAFKAARAGIALGGDALGSLHPRRGDRSPERHGAGRACRQRHAAEARGRRARDEGSPLSREPIDAHPRSDRRGIAALLGVHAARWRLERTG